jgi:hypothetical protein
MRLACVEPAPRLVFVTLNREYIVEDGLYAIWTYGLWRISRKWLKIREV